MKQLFVLLPLAFLLTTGCGTVEALRRPFVTTTNAVPVVTVLPATTNIVTREVAASTNVTQQADGTFAVTVRPAFTTNLVTITPATSVTNYVTNLVTTVSPGLISGLETAQAINASINPTPSAPLINLALTGIIGALGFFARLKTRQAGEAHSLLRTVIAGVEEAKSDPTKEAIAKFSNAMGNAPQLDALVQRITK